MYILGIETSCDETAVAILSISAKGGVKVLSNVVSSQIEIHKKYGGVVPEIAAREHVLHIIPVVNESLLKSGIKVSQIKAISVTVGPGLVTSLLAGVETAKVLAYAWKKPLVPVNHIEGHIHANFINMKKTMKFPALVLTVSGGHTNLVLLESRLKYKIIGETRDDAAGEAFDKGAKMMDIGYPGGPIVSQYALAAKKSDIVLPRPMINSAGFDFSFSGLKTALLYTLKKDSEWQKKIPEYCFELQEAIVETLVSKTIKAAKKYDVKTVMLSGGVSANRRLREVLEKTVKEKLDGVDFHMPELAYTTDNAAMIAMAGYYRFINKKTVGWNKIKMDCNLELR
ncbi:MAG: tRNA (adenosine(37)-N6)-threonylcarbamoyltransferase complex transferase subunit TsaD [Candidatus Falkowbacteria bacterium]